MRYEMNSNVLRAKPRANSHILKLAEDDDAVVQYIYILDLDVGRAWDLCYGLVLNNEDKIWPISCSQ